LFSSYLFSLLAQDSMSIDATVVQMGIARAGSLHYMGGSTRKGCALTGRANTTSFSGHRPLAGGQQGAGDRIVSTRAERTRHWLGWNYRRKWQSPAVEQWLKGL